MRIKDSVLFGFLWYVLPERKTYGIINLWKGVFGMYQIALCDDENEELDRMEIILGIYRKQHAGCDFSIDRFRDADELLEMVREQKYAPNLLFMDIYMPGKLGVDAAKELREMGNSCQLVFLTTSKEFALEAFRVGAVQYLVKPVSDKDIVPVLDQFAKEMEEEEKKYLLLRVDNTIRKLALSDIVYCEAQKKCQCMYMADETKIVLRLTMAKVCEMLSGYRAFVRVGVSYVVNLEHIISLNAKELLMDNKKTIYLPRGAYQGLRDQYFDYYCEADMEGS